MLVFKVANEAENWKDSIRFTDATGQPVKGIKVTLARRRCRVVCAGSQDIMQAHGVIALLQVDR